MGRMGFNGPRMNSFRSYLHGDTVKLEIAFHIQHEQFVSEL